ncbi:dihydroorotate dehydrogenase (quinone), mitochondrial [Chrysoperla carnea]|uniref:dihydroorotate dehydrogenase (quinone), mitochondrial n=1 Tax=Chrysoperla carnea TaxID=189513 RepID=UPI001D0604DA|nr:dihydroorotate dehydrogenase (quinone), mitochondrial [Chrysoperla carnea]
MSRQQLVHKVKTIISMTLGGGVVFTALNIYKGSEKFYDDVLIPLTHSILGPEKAHEAVVFINKYRLLPRSHYKDPEILNSKFLNLQVPNPVGIAAGFDKHGESVLGLTDIGFGFVEIGSITPKPQEGNPKPRVFRLPEDSAVINRYGFNSDGHDKVLERIEKLRNSDKFDGILGINLGKNKESDNPIDDYIQGIQKFGKYASYFVINVSSPNTPGLRTLQNEENLKVLLPAVISARNQLDVENKPPILLKLAPDLSQEERKSVASILKKRDCRIDGLIISNTTIARNDLKSIHYKNETGGLSGRPLKEKSTQMIKEMYQLTNGQIPIIGAGGIFTGHDAYEKIRAGASLIQIYTSFIYHGPPRITRIKEELQQLLEFDGFENISQVVGIDAKK